MDKWLNDTEGARAEKIYSGEGKKKKKIGMQTEIVQGRSYWLGPQSIRKA